MYVNTCTVLYKVVVSMRHEIINNQGSISSALVQYLETKVGYLELAPEEDGKFLVHDTLCSLLPLGPLDFLQLQVPERDGDLLGGLVELHGAVAVEDVPGLVIVFVVAAARGGADELDGLLFADDGHGHLRGRHVHVEHTTDKQAHGGGEASVGLHYLRGLLLDDERTRNQIAQELRELGQELRDHTRHRVRIVLSHAAVDILQLLDLLSHGPYDVREALAHLLKGVKIGGYGTAVARELLFGFPLD